MKRGYEYEVEFKNIYSAVRAALDRGLTHVDISEAVRAAENDRYQDVMDRRERFRDEPDRDTDEKARDDQ